MSHHTRTFLRPACGSAVERRFTAAVPCFFLLMLMAFLPAQLRANVTGVRATASPAAVPYNASTTVVVTWVVDVVSFGQAPRISSTSADFLGPGVIGSNPTVISRRL